MIIADTIYTSKSKPKADPSDNTRDPRNQQTVRSSAIKRDRTVSFVYIDNLKNC